jgi:hypothetical protein
VFLDLGYARGVEDFESFSIDRIGAFRAHTGSAGVHVDLTSLTSLGAAYEFQSRRNGVEAQRVTIGLSQSF